MRKFTAGLDYNNENHTLQHTPTSGTRFVGQPSPEIDAAWMDLAGGMLSNILDDTSISNIR
jgi:hypothetical protein